MLAVDGRVTDEHGTICTDAAVKFVATGHLTWAFAGDVGALQAMIARLQELPAVRLADVRSAVAARPDGAGEWSALVYDARQHALFSADSDGSVLREHGRYAAIGCAADFALGFMAGRSAKRAVWTTAQARVELKQAIKQTARRNANVSMRSTVLAISADTGRTNVRG